MNGRQRIVVFIGAVIIAAMLAFPPMQGTGYGEAGCQDTGYGFLFNSRSTYIAALDSHTGRRLNNGWCYWQINQERLKYQIVITIVLTLGVTVLLGTGRKS